MRNPLLKPLQTSDLDTELGVLAATSPAASYVRTLGSAGARRTQMSAIVQAAELLAPGVLPHAAKRGRLGNLRERFLVASALPWGQLKVERLGELRAGLIQRGLSPSTSNRILAAVRGVLQAAWLSGLMDAETLARGKAVLKVVRGERVSRGTHLSKMQLRNIFVVARERGGAAGPRDSAAIALLAVGLRRAEVAAVAMRDFDPKTGRLVVHGKGNKERVVFLSNGSLEAVQEWLKVRGDLSEGPLLRAIGKDGKVRPVGISQQAVYSIFMTVAQAAGVSATPHDLRRTFGGEALNAGVDLSTLQALLGHASPATTSRYDKRPEEVRAKAMKLIHIPFGTYS